jgi:hypothetical protein
MLNNKLIGNVITKLVVTAIEIFASGSATRTAAGAAM